MTFEECVGSYLSECEKNNNNYNKILKLKNFTLICNLKNKENLVKNLPKDILSRFEIKINDYMKDNELYVIK